MNLNVRIALRRAQQKRFRSEIYRKAAQKQSNELCRSCAISAPVKAYKNDDHGIEGDGADLCEVSPEFGELQLPLKQGRCSMSPLGRQDRRAVCLHSRALKCR